MTKSEKIKKWVEVVIQTEKNSNSSIICPECEVGKLIIKDEIIEGHPVKIDRYFICDNCGKWNVALMSKIVKDGN